MVGWADIYGIQKHMQSLNLMSKLTKSSTRIEQHGRMRGRGEITFLGKCRADMLKGPQQRSDCTIR